MPSSPAAARRPPVVLIGDAQEWFARALETVLVQGGYGVVKAYTASTLLQQLERAAPDAIILAFDLPGATGLGLCRQLRAESRVTAGTPIVLTQPAPATRRETLNALRAGASELWVGQQLDSEELLLRLAAGLRAKADADRAWASGLVDPTTELYNSRGLARRVLEIGAEARRRARPMAAVAFTIPKNGAPDVVLVTRVLREAARASDAVGRIGPREFIVVAPEAGPDAALRLAERLADAFSGKRRTRPTRGASGRGGGGGGNGGGREGGEGRSGSIERMGARPASTLSRSYHRLLSPGLGPEVGPNASSTSLTTSRCGSTKVDFPSRSP